MKIFKLFWNTYWNLKYVGLVWKEQEPFSQERSETEEDREGAPGRWMAVAALGWGTVEGDRQAQSATAVPLRGQNKCRLIITQKIRQAGLFLTTSSLFDQDLAEPPTALYSK